MLPRPPACYGGGGGAPVRSRGERERERERREREGERGKTGERESARAQLGMVRFRGGLSSEFSSGKPEIPKIIFEMSRNISCSNTLLDRVSTRITQEFRFYYKKYPGIFHGILLAIWAHFTNHTDYGTNCTDYGHTVQFVKYAQIAKRIP